MNEIIKQVKTDEELKKLSSEIIDLLKDCNSAEKYKIIHSLFTSLTDVLKEEGIIIFKEKDASEVTRE